MRREGKKTELTTEFLLEKVLEALSTLGVPDQLTKVEGPSLYPHLSWDFHPAKMTTDKCNIPWETGAVLIAGLGGGDRHQPPQQSQGP